MGAHARRAVKSLIGHAFSRTGLWDRLLGTWARRHEVVILTYHRVIENWERTLDYSQPGMVVTAKTFDRQLHFLKEKFDIVPLGTLIADRSINWRPVRPRCIITFDDGWRDNYMIAFPILRKHGVPATVFLTTDFIGTSRLFWHTELISLLLQGELSQFTRDRVDLEAYPSPVSHRLMHLARTRQAPCAQDLDPLIEAVKETCDEDTIEELIRDLANAVGLRRPLFPGRRFFLGWEQVCEMAAAGIEIGSHGCSHRILTRLKEQEGEEELVRSRADIERRIGRAVRHFAFPNGAVNSDLLTMAGKAGYRTACLCASGPDAGPSGPLALRRVGMHEGISAEGEGSFSEVLLLLWLLRAPRMKLV